MVWAEARGQYNTFFSCIEYFVSLQMCIKENVRWGGQKEMFSVPFLACYGPISPDLFFKGSSSFPSFSMIPHLTRKFPIPYFSNENLQSQTVRKSKIVSKNSEKI